MILSRVDGCEELYLSGVLPDLVVTKFLRLAAPACLSLLKICIQVSSSPGLWELWETDRDPPQGGRFSKRLWETGRDPP